jgi:hypothetical protein
MHAYTLFIPNQERLRGMQHYIDPLAGIDIHLLHYINI